MLNYTIRGFILGYAIHTSAEMLIPAIFRNSGQAKNVFDLMMQSDIFLPIFE